MANLRFRLGNLSPDVKAEDLINFFDLPLDYDEEAATINLVIDLKTKTCKGYGFLQLPVELRDLVVCKDGVRLKGQNVSVKQVMKYPVLRELYDGDLSRETSSHLRRAREHSTCSDGESNHGPPDPRKQRPVMNLDLPAFAFEASRSDEVRSHENSPAIFSGICSSTSDQLKIENDSETEDDRKSPSKIQKLEDSKWDDTGVSNLTCSGANGNHTATGNSSLNDNYLGSKQAQLPSPSNLENREDHTIADRSVEESTSQMSPVLNSPDVIPTPTNLLTIKKEPLVHSPPGQVYSTDVEKGQFSFNPPTNIQGTILQMTPIPNQSPFQQATFCPLPIPNQRSSQGQGMLPIVPMPPLPPLPVAPHGFVPTAGPHPFLTIPFPHHSQSNQLKSLPQRSRSEQDNLGHDVYDLVDIAAILTHPKYRQDLPQVIERAKKTGVKMIIPGMGVRDSIEAAKISYKNNGVVHFLAGVHPHNSNLWQPETSAQLEQLIKAHTGCVGIGECGLDYNRNFSAREAQILAFEQQVQLACRLKKPLLVHNRESTADVLAILSRYKSQLPPVVIHCFTGSRDDAVQCLAMGFYIGVTGNIFRDMTVRRMLEQKELPLDRLLLETDSPFMYPNLEKAKLTKTELGMFSMSSRYWHHLVSFERNEPCTLPLITELVASCAKCTPKKIAEITRRNSANIFNI